MSYGPDPHFALAEFEQAVPDRKVMGIAFVGSDGVTRVWLNNDVESIEQHAWVGDAFKAAAKQALNMTPGAA